MSRLHIILPVILFAGSVHAGFAQSSGSLPAHGFIVVANKGEHTVGIVDPEAGRQLATVEEGGTTGHEVIVSSDGRFAYEPIYGNSGVGKPGTDGTNMVVIDLAARKIVGNVDWGRGVRPHDPVLGPKDGMLYVTTELDKTISIIDPKTLKIVGSIPTGQAESHMLTISHDGRRGYTANVGPGTVSVLDMQARKTITIIPVSSQTQRISISPDDSMVFTADQSKPQLAVIDTASNKVKTWVPLPAAGYGTAPTPDGRWLVVAIPSTNQVAVVDLRAMKVAHTLDVPKAPQAVAMQPDGKMAYVSCDSSNKIAAIRVSDWSVEKLIDAGKGTDGITWASVK